MVLRRSLSVKTSCLAISTSHLLEVNLRNLDESDSQGSQVLDLVLYQVCNKHVALVVDNIELLEGFLVLFFILNNQYLRSYFRC